MNQYYPGIKNQMLLGTFNWTSGTYKLHMLNSLYVYDQTDTSLADISSSSRVILSPSTRGISQAISGKTVVINDMRASAASFLAITGDVPVTQFVLVLDTGVDATSLLVAHFDQGFGLPFIPSGGNYSIAWGVINGTVAEL